MLEAAMVCIVLSIGSANHETGVDATVKLKFVFVPPLVQGGKPLVIPLPDTTPFDKGSIEVNRYWNGYVEGYTDVMRPRFCCRSNDENRNAAEYRNGYQDGYGAARMVKPRKPGG